MNVAAVVLCGGESRRMGRSKAWLPFGPELMLERVVRLVGSVAQPIVVVAAPGQEIPPVAVDGRVTIVRDPISGRGPLQGLAAGLVALPAEPDIVFATATDVPFLEPAWITHMAGLMGDHDLIIPFVSGYYHPLAGLYRRSAVLSAIEQLLAEDRLRPIFLVEMVKSRVVGQADLESVDPDLQTLRNLNFPGDYQRALADAGFAGTE
jgi:molybdopterin-guanine dinucleotide biosynthesis protein A